MVTSARMRAEFSGVPVVLRGTLLHGGRLGTLGAGAALWLSSTVNGAPRVEQLPIGPVEYRLVAEPRSRPDVLVIMHGGHMRADLPVGESALLDEGYTLLVPSRPGYGRTPLSSGPSPERFADATAQLCARLGIKSVLAVVGVSAGGPSAVALAARHPELVRTLLLQSARSALPFPSGAARLAAPVAFNPRVEALTWSGIRHLMQRTPRVGLAAMMSSHPRFRSAASSTTSQIRRSVSSRRYSLPCDPVAVS
jgi:pimeloyl-ACP methyl ester carboxylesterase